MVWIPITASENYDIEKENIMAKEYKPIKQTNIQKRQARKWRKERKRRRKQGTGRGKAR